MNACCCFFVFCSLSHSLHHHQPSNLSHFQDSNSQPDFFLYTLKLLLSFKHQQNFLFFVPLKVVVVEKPKSSVHTTSLVFFFHLLLEKRTKTGQLGCLYSLKSHHLHHQLPTTQQQLSVSPTIIN